MVEKKYMRRCIIGVEKQRRKQRCKSSSTTKPDKVVDLQPMLQESHTGVQAVRIASTRRQEFFVAVDRNFGSSY